MKTQTATVIVAFDHYQVGETITDSPAKIELWQMLGVAKPSDAQPKKTGRRRKSAANRGSQQQTVSPPSITPDDASQGTKLENVARVEGEKIPAPENDGQPTTRD